MRTKVRWTTIALLCATWAAAQPEPADAQLGDIPRLSASQAVQAAKRNEVRLVDVRMSAQRELGHIRGDVYMPVEEVAARASELPRDRPLVFYCSCPAEELALEAAQALLQSDANADVAVLVGGYDAWRAAGGEIDIPSTWEQVFHLSDPPTGWG